MTTHYVRNELGAIHSVDDDHFREYLHTTTRGGATRLKPEFEEITEDEARAEHPQLFGHPDPEIVRSMTSSEIKELRERRAFEAELLAELEADATAAEGDDESDGESASTKRR